MLTLQQDVVRHMKVTACAHCPLIGVLHSPHSGAAMQGILWPPRAHNVLVSGCTQLQPLQRHKPDTLDTAACSNSSSFRQLVSCAGEASVQHRVRRSQSVYRRVIYNFFSVAFCPCILNIYGVGRICGAGRIRYSSSVIGQSWFNLDLQIHRTREWFALHSVCILTLFCNSPLERLHIYSNRNELYSLTLHSLLQDRNNAVL